MRTPHSPVLQDYKHGQENSRSRSKTLRSSGPVLAGLDVLELVRHLQYPTHMDTFMSNNNQDQTKRRFTCL